jgi:hypothetical protein
MCTFVGTSSFYVRTNIVVLSTVDAIHLHFQCFAWILRRNFVCISFFPSFLVWPLLPSFKCRGLLLHFITFNDTHTHTHIALIRIPLDEWSARRRDLWLTTHNIHRNIHPRHRRNSKPQSQQARAQTHAVDRAASGIGLVWTSCN